MKLPIPLFLYTAALGLAGTSGWIVYRMMPLWRKQAHDEATSSGMRDAKEKISLGKGQGQGSVDWSYSTRTAQWWAEFLAVNFIGKLPPPPPKTEDPSEAKKPDVVADVRPLDQIIELVSLVYDPQDQGKGELSHVIVRYRPEANVQPPEWYVRETTSVTSGGPAAAQRDVSPPRVGGHPNGPQGKPLAGTGQGPKVRGAAGLPTSIQGREVLQKVWIQGGTDPRREPKLWPPFSDIRLVRVDPTAQSAYFVREALEPKAGVAAPEPKEEQLLKSAMGLPQDMVRELHRLQGRALGVASGGTQTAAPQSGMTWRETEETALIDNVRHIGRREEQRFRDNPNELWDKINVDTYVSKSSNTRGLEVRNVDAQVASKFGVVQGDVLIEVNGKSVQTKAQAVQFGEGEYKKGVRTFVTKWISAGQVVERIYQASDR